MKTLCSLVLAAGLATLHGAAPDQAVRHAEVTLPFTEIQALLAAAQPPAEVPPPVPAAISHAWVSLALGEGKATAEFDIDVFAKGWRLVPLLKVPFTLVTAELPGATLLPHGGMLCALADHPGHFHAKMEFQIPASLLQAGRDAILIQLAPVAAGNVQISSAPPKCRAWIQSGEISATTGSLPLPLEGGQIAVRIAEDKPQTPTTWTAALQTLVRQTGEGFTCESRIHFSGASGSGLAAQVALPPGCTHVEITGPDLQPVHAQGDRIALRWQTADVLERDITLSYSLPLPPAGAAWRIRIPQIADAASSTALTAVAPLPGIAFSEKPSDAELPGWMSAAASDDLWQSTSTGEILVTPRLLPHLEVQTARIPEASYRTRLVIDGSLLCEANLAIQHRGPLRWRFTLPKGSELLNCTVDGRATNPLLNEDGSLELVLGGKSDSDTRSGIALSYTARGPAFAPVEGRLSLLLPGTPLFIESLVWTLALPDGYEPTAFEGNVEPEGGGGAEMTFRKRLVRNETPSLEIYYRKHDSTR
jgi:hypothetical protein